MEKANWRDAKKTAKKARAKSIYNFIEWRHLLTTGNKATFLDYKRFIERVKNLGISMKISGKAIDWLVDNGFDKTYGARPLKRVVQRSIENEFAKKMLSGEFAENDEVLIDSKKGQLIIEKNKAAGRKKVSSEKIKSK